MTEYVTIERGEYERLLKIVGMVEGLQKEIETLRIEVEELKKRLRVYENPHTPSSQQRIKERKESQGEPRKRGAPEGHDGDTRAPPEPTGYKDLKPSGHCAGKGVEILDIYRKVIEDVEIRPIATEFTIYRYKCLGCDSIFETKDANLPTSGVFGPKYSGFMTSLHYIGGMPFGKLSLISGICLGIELTRKGMEDVVYRSAEIFEPDFKNIEDAIKHSKYIRSDETSYPFNKKKWWAWNISNGMENVVAIRPSRGANVIEGYIGEDYDGVLQCDFFKSYQGFEHARMAGCWEHLRRDAEELADECGKEGKTILDEIHNMYGTIMGIKEVGKEGTRGAETKTSEMNKRLETLLKRKWRRKRVAKFVERLVDFRDWLFTCMRYREAEATNNSSERDVRKLVLARKISSCHRSEIGVHSREIMMSVVLTEMHKGNNPAQFIMNGIMQHNLN